MDNLTVLLPNGYDAGWDRELVWMFGRRAKSLAPTAISTSGPSSS